EIFHQEVLRIYFPEVHLVRLIWELLSINFSSLLAQSLLHANLKYLKLINLLYLTSSLWNP
ncbi:hypothetical protein, partial [Salmonella sp. s54836]|uniref:hypothetical protein n=1 Tax=Salmonella sp. s54836 TaxID=3159673 RepID=UPI003981693E